MNKALRKKICIYISFCSYDLHPQASHVACTRHHKRLPCSNQIDKWKSQTYYTLISHETKERVSSKLWRTRYREIWSFNNISSDRYLFSWPHHICHWKRRVCQGFVHAFSGCLLRLSIPCHDNHLSFLFSNLSSQTTDDKIIITIDAVMYLWSYQFCYIAHSFVHYEGCKRHFLSI